MTKFTQSFIQLLKNIEKRPRMFGINSVRDLELFLSGFYFLLSDDQHLIQFDGFNDWIKNKYDFQKLNINYVKVVEFISSDNFASLEVFFKEVDIFFREANLESIYTSN